MTPLALKALVIFGLSYVLISVRQIRWLPLGRPSSAMVGATLMVMCGVVSPQQAYACVDGNTIVLLLGMMVLTEHLRDAGFFQLAARWTFQVARTPRSLLFWLAMTSGILSALFVNDTICLLLTPLVVEVLTQARLPRFPYLMALATASNIGSVMTLVGNPQNMIIGSLAEQHQHGLTYLFFASRLVPVGLICLGFHILLLQWLFRRELAVAWTELSIPEAKIDRPLLIRTLVVAALVSMGFCFQGVNPAWATLSGASLLFLFDQRHPAPADILARVNWLLLLFFAGLFILVHGLETSGLVAEINSLAHPLWETSLLMQKINLVWVSVIGCNIVSNVPFIKLLEGQMTEFANPAQMWMLLALATTYAGNLTLLGSVANVIVMEMSGEPVGFWQYFRIGLPVTVLSCVVGTTLLILIA